MTEPKDQKMTIRPIIKHTKNPPCISTIVYFLYIIFRISLIHLIWLTPFMTCFVTHVGRISCKSSRYYTCSLFILSVFYLFGPSVINSVVQFSIYSALRIRPNSPVRKLAIHILKQITTIWALFNSFFYVTRLVCLKIKWSNLSSCPSYINFIVAPNTFPCSHKGLFTIECNSLFFGAFFLCWHKHNITQSKSATQ